MPRTIPALCLTLLPLALGAAPDSAARDLAIVNATLYPAPFAEPVENATVLIRDGQVAAAGPGLDPEDLPVLDAGGRAVTAGLWNAHVHLTQPEVAEQPDRVLRDMLLRYGFTSALDTGSDLRQTRRLQAEIGAGRLDGPRLLTANGSFVPTNGTPAYLPGMRLPEIARAAEAAPLVSRFLDDGADGIKIFAGSYQSPTETLLLPPAVIRAVADAAHDRGSFVVAHPNNRDGLINAMENGADVLAHTAPSAGPLGTDLVRTMLDQDVALIPTLKLWSWELARHGVPAAETKAYQVAGVDQLREYHQAGGEILFGTDVGYMTDYDTTEELTMMQGAGMGFHDILAALTRNPARRFAAEPGTVAAGAPGDLVIYEADPAEDAAAFARVAFTVRAGRVVYSAVR